MSTHTSACRDQVKDSLPQLRWIAPSAQCRPPSGTAAWQSSNSTPQNPGQTSAFGGDVDYAMLVKLYGVDPEADHRYSPAKCLGQQVTRITGVPDLAEVGTAHVERQNLTMRMGIRRFTRLTNAFSRKVENLATAVSLHFMYYNFARPHMSLANPCPMTPAMAAGVTDHVWKIEEIVALLGA
jgi:hypothetical protein